MVNLTWTSSPSGAKVYRSGNLMGTTPLDISFNDGTYTFKIVLDGYETEEFERNVIGEYNLHTNLIGDDEEETGEIDIQPDPEDEEEEEEEEVVEEDPPVEEEEEEKSLFDKIKDAIIASQLAPGTPLGEIVETILGFVDNPKAEVQEELIKGGLVVGGYVVGGALLGTYAGGTAIGAGGGIILGVSGKTFLGAAGTIASIDILAVWLASDNIITGAGFTVRKLRDAVRYRVMSKEEALAEMDKIKGWVDDAAKFVETSVNLNPTLLPFRQPFLINNEKGRKDIEIEEKLLRGFKS